MSAHTDQLETDQLETRPRVLVIAGPGTNRDPDLAFAFELAGADPTVVLAHELVRDPGQLDQADLLAIAGGFSYGDALGAGRMLALDLTVGLGEALTTFVESRRPVIGICNGFQVLTRAGLLPGALGHNDSGRFECRWVELEAEPDSVCVWTRWLDTTIQCPIAHGEGRYVHPDPVALAAAGQVALRYRPNAATGDVGNPNGSVADIAGVTNATGTVLGLMPHPENFIVPRQHPDYQHPDYWARGGPQSGPASDAMSHTGLALFRAGVDYARTLTRSHST